MTLTNAQKSKERSKLYKLIEGTNEIVAPAGQSDTGKILFADVPEATETVTIGGYIFEYQVAASEAAGTSAGTAADPHLITIGVDLSAAITSLITQVLAETATTGAWGFLHPVDAVSATKTDTNTSITLVFFPGVSGVTLAGSVGDETITAPTGGVVTKPISLEHSVNILDTTDSAVNEEYYVLDYRKDCFLLIQGQELHLPLGFSDLFC